MKGFEYLSCVVMGPETLGNCPSNRKRVVIAKRVDRRDNDFSNGQKRVWALKFIDTSVPGGWIQGIAIVHEGFGGGSSRSIKGIMRVMRRYISSGRLPSFANNI